MAKITKKMLDKYESTKKDALMKFDLKSLRKWMKKNDRVTYEQFTKETELIQMAVMCKMIFNRTDMLDTEAHKKACQWLKEHNMSGRLF